MEDLIYLDNAATTKIHPEVLEAMLPFLQNQYGNASSTHALGWYAKGAVKKARTTICNYLGCNENELLFTSGATEGINMAIKGVFNLYQKKGKHIVTVKTEHKAVLDTLSFLEKKGAEVTYLDVDENGKVQVEDLQTALREDTVLLCVMHVNNETGVVQDIQELGKVARDKGVIFLSDCTQSIGKLDVNVSQLPVDIVPFSAHKINGPKGVGALFVRRKKPRVALESLLHGGGQEEGMRAGTLNVPGIVGLGKAVELLSNQSVDRFEEYKRIVLDILSEFNPTINGSATAAHILNITLSGVKASRLMKAIPSLCFSLGSACSSEKPEPSHVLTAMGLDKATAQSSFRLSFGIFNTEQEVEKAAQLLKQAATEIKV